MPNHRAFERSFDSIPAIFAFTADVFARQRFDHRLLPTVDLAVEELFTNMVKYSTMSDASVDIDLTGIEGGVEVTLIDHDVEPFDVTRSPDADLTLPIEQRTPGGLGLHLIRRLVDSVEYEYARESRRSRITFRMTRSGKCGQPDAANTGGRMLAIEYGQDGSVVIAGRLDAAQAAAAQSFLDQVAGTVTLDCSRLEYISSAGLGVLLKTQKRLFASAGKIRLSGVQPHLMDVFVYSGLDQLFEIEPAR